MPVPRYPNTTTPSYPHEGSIGETHVDWEHRGEDGKVDYKTRHDTSDNAKKMGELQKQLDEESD